MIVSEQEDFGKLELRINEILKEKHISKNRICKEMDIPSEL